MPRTKRGQANHLGLRRQLRSNMTGPELRLWSKLRTRQFLRLKFRRQHGIGPYIVDFYCPDRSVVIEVDGESHADNEQINNDKKRDTYLHSLGIRVIRYLNEDVMKNLDGVLEDLQKRLPSESAPSSSSN